MKIIVFILFLIMLYFSKGCVHSNVEFIPINDYNVIGKTKEPEESVDVRDLIRPQETYLILQDLNLKNKTVEEKTDIIIQYISGFKNFSENKDHWQYPYETIEKGGGDCEDKVFLLVSALIQSGLNDVYAVKGRYLGGGHFWVEYKDKIIDPSRKDKKIMIKDKTVGYNPFFKFNDKEIYINKDIQQTGGI